MRKDGATMGVPMQRTGTTAEVGVADTRTDSRSV